MSEALQEIVALFGQPVAGNPTQYMIEKAFAQAGLDWRYLTLEVAPADLADAIRGMRAMGFRGANLTIPHKVAVVPLLDQLSPAAKLIGAVNCIHRVNDELRGENADGKGFLQSLQKVVDPVGKRVVILGAGGAARAIAVELGLVGAAHLTIVNRTLERAQPLVDTLIGEGKGAEFVRWEGDYAIDDRAEILINATSIGLDDANVRAPITISSLRPELVVADVVCSPVETAFLQEARERGCRTLDGIGMLVQQGVMCFKIWTGLDADAGLMRESLEEFLGVL